MVQGRDGDHQIPDFTEDKVTDHVAPRPQLDAFLKIWGSDHPAKKPAVDHISPGLNKSDADKEAELPVGIHITRNAYSSVFADEHVASLGLRSLLKKGVILRC